MPDLPVCIRYHHIGAVAECEKDLRTVVYQGPILDVYGRGVEIDLNFLLFLCTCLNLEDVDLTKPLMGMRFPEANRVFKSDADDAGGIDWKYASATSIPTEVISIEGTS